MARRVLKTESSEKSLNSFEKYSNNSRLTSYQNHYIKNAFKDSLNYNMDLFEFIKQPDSMKKNVKAEEPLELPTISDNKIQLNPIIGS